MPHWLKVFVCILPLLINIPNSIDASEDPVTAFILNADSLAQAGGDDLLVPYILENSILIGATVGQLLDVALEIGDGGNKDAERENVTFAEHLGRLYQENGGSHIPLGLVEIYEGWTTEQRAQRRRAKGLEKEAVNARNTGELDRAVELLHQAKALYEGIEDKRSIAVIWGSLGVVHWYRGDMDMVLENYEKALIARREIEDRILEGKTLNGLGSANFMKGNYETAADFFKQAIELRRRTGDIGGLGTSLTYCGNANIRLGHLVDARDKFEEALLILERSGSINRRLELLSSIAILYSEMGSFKRSNEAYGRAIELSRTAGEQITEASCRSNLALNLRDMGHLRESLAQLDTVSMLMNESPDPIISATYLRERGLTYIEMGELDNAREDLLAYLEKSKELEDPLYSIEALINLGYLYRKLGAFEEGLSCIDQARAMAEETENVRILRNAAALAADLEDHLGRFDEALEHRHWALERDQADGFEALVIEDKAHIANLQAQMGETEEARAGYAALRPLVHSLGRKDLEWVLQFGIAHTYEEEDPDSSYFHYEEAFRLLEQSRAALGGAEIRTGFLGGETRRLYEEVARYYASLSDGEGGDTWSAHAFHTMERAKARSLLDLLEQSIEAQTSHAEEALLDSLYRLDKSSPTYTAEERMLKSHYIELREERLSRTFAPFKLQEAVTGISDVQKALSRGTVLLEYALGDTISLLWVIHRKGHELFELPNRGSLRIEVARLRDALSRPGTGDAILRKVARSLYGKLVLPAEQYLSKAKRLVIVPDGVLFEVPFELLLTEEPMEDVGWDEQPFLARSFAPVYAPSASIYLKLLQSKERGKYHLDLLALGDPDFSTLSRRADIAEASLPQLPHTRSEIVSISSHIKDKRKDVLLGREATEAGLKEKLKRVTPRIVHLATHGLVDPIEPVLSSVVLSSDVERGEDGYLHTLEILSLPLDVGLVVVSACESARGRVSRGEGVVGLRRAFIASGAGGVVASLWAVSDESTAALMKKFYERMLGKKKPAGEALKDARLALIENARYAHPFYWSAFIMIGTDKSPW